MAISNNFFVRQKFQSSKYFSVWMPVPLVGGAAKNFVFLELAKTISFMDGH
jgi:hypothetical protein